MMRTKHEHEAGATCGCRPALMEAGAIEALSVALERRLVAAARMAPRHRPSGARTT
jgi:hypothetical protein